MSGRGLDPAGHRHFNAYGEWAAALLERGDIDEATEALLALARVAGEGHRVGEHAATLVSVARSHRVRRDAGAAVRALRQARTLLNEAAPGTPLLHALDAAEARVRIDTGDGVRAERLIRSLPADADRSLLWARLRLARGTDARRVLAALDPASPREAAEQHVLLAWATLRRGARLAEAHLLRAAEIAADSGQALLLIDAGPPLLDLAAEASRRHAHDGVTWLLGAVQRDASAAAPASAAPQAGPVLSRGELELLALLPGRETVAGIAGILSVTPNTVKTRLQRLYRKLGASGRDEAIAAARSRGLL